VPSDQGRLSKAWKGRTENIVTEPVDSEAEGKVIATARMDRIAKRLLVARGRASGLPELRVGAQLEIHEVGDRFSGNYFVTSCEHVIDGHGYRTEFECQREEY
jgi:phage protein D